MMYTRINDVLLRYFELIDESFDEAHHDLQSEPKAPLEVHIWNLLVIIVFHSDLALFAANASHQR